MVELLLREPVQFRMGTDQEPGRCAPVGGQGCPGNHSRSLRPEQETQADDADDRSVVAFRPDLRADLAPLPREPGRIRGRLRPRLVQTDPPRHGPHRALSRPAGAEGAADLAGPDSRARPPGDRRRRHRVAQAEDPRPGLFRIGPGVGGLGLGGDLPRFGQARRSQWRAHSLRSAEGLGNQQPAAAGAGAAEARRDTE